MYFTATIHTAAGTFNLLRITADNATDALQSAMNSSPDNLRDERGNPIFIQPAAIVAITVKPSH